LASPENLGLNAGSRRLAPKRSMSKLSKQSPKKRIFWAAKTYLQLVSKLCTVGAFSDQKSS
jgi:hypothetical protein